MKKLNIYQVLLFILLSFFTLPLFAWDHSVEVGYGISHDINHSRYNNSGYLLTSDLYPLWRTPMTYWTLNGGLGQWHTTAPVYKNLTTAALALALRLYPQFNIGDHYPTYLLGSVGPTLLSNRKFGLNTQGANVTFQWNAGLGVEFNQIDVNFRMVHYSNAYLAHPDEGFTVLYMLSLGYLF